MQRQPRRTAHQWRQILTDQEKSGLNLRAYSKKNQLNYGSLIQWRQKLKRSKPTKATANKFVALHQSCVDNFSSDKIKINYDYNIELELPGDYPTTQLIRLLKGLSC